LDCALTLATAKARHVAQRYPDSLVIGADQILAVDTEWFDKPADRSAAQSQLMVLRGRPHQLVTAACVVRGSDRVWHATSMPQLTMRHFTDRFLERYLAAEGAALFGSVGAYRLEGRGVQLFSKVEGDYFEK